MKRLNYCSGILAFTSVTYLLKSVKRAANQPIESITALARSLVITADSEGHRLVGALTRSLYTLLHPGSLLPSLPIDSPYSTDSILVDSHAGLINSPIGNSLN